MAVDKLHAAAYPANNRVAVGASAGDVAMVAVPVVDPLEESEAGQIPKPHLRRVYRLEDLVKRITAKNVHDELDFGEPVGREVL